MDHHDYSFHLNGMEFNFRVHRLDCVDNGIIFFLPSAKSDSTRDLYPYYPRQKWHSELLDYCVIYISDPCDKLVEGFSPGSWFFNRDESVLPFIKYYILNIVDLNSKKILVYGSSMGGYAALLLGQLIGANFVIAECPQLDLFKYKPFRALLGGYLSEAVFDRSWVSVFKYFNQFGFGAVEKIDIYLNYGDLIHVGYLVDELKSSANVELIKSMRPGFLNVFICNDHNGYGHVNFPSSVGVSNIKKLLS